VHAVRPLLCHAMPCPTRRGERPRVCLRFIRNYSEFSWARPNNSNSIDNQNWPIVKICGTMAKISNLALMLIFLQV
jgi:hypothetical protein